VKHFTYVVIGLIDIGIASYIFAHSKNGKQRFFFLTFSAAIGCWTGSFWWIYNTSNPLFAGRITVFFSIFIPVFLYFLTKYFLRPKAKLKLSEILIFLVTTVGLVKILPHKDFIADVSILNNQIVFLPGPLYLVMATYLATVCLFCILQLVFAYIRSSLDSRKQIFFVLLGITVATIFGLLFNFILPSLGYSKFNVLGNLSTIILVFSFGWASLKHGVFNIKVSIPRISAFTLTSIIVLGSLLATQTLVQPYSESLSQMSLLTLSIFWAFTGHALRQKLQTSTERLWLRDWYDPQAVIKELSKTLSPLFARDHLFLAAAKVLDEVMHLRKMTIIFNTTPETTNTGFSVYSKSGTPLGQLSPNSAIPQFFANPTSVLRTSQIPQTLLSEITPFETELHIVVPLYSPDGFEGLIILGKRDSEAPYSAKDINLLDTVAATIGVFLDRMRPYEKIQDDFNRNQKKLYDLERQIARSEKIASVMLALKEFNHELKTPLSITRMMIDQLPATDAPLRAFKTDALHQIDRATAIVRQTLSLSEPKARTVAPVDLIPIIHEATKMIPERITFTTELAQLPAILGVEDDLVSLLNNLIKNACEAIESTGTIRISGHVDPEHVFISITDSGCGIAQDDLPKIWDPFFVGDSKKTDGHGLGLSIVFRIVREHLGHITVDSTPGRGAIFVVQLPLKNP